LGALVPLMLGLAVLERTLHAIDAWVLGTGIGHHSPEHYGVLVALPLLLGAFVLSLRDRGAGPRGGARHPAPS
jgi:hypothetical protein